MQNPPVIHERRRYIVDVECTDAGVKTSSKGLRSVRSLSILRVKELEGVVVPPKRDNDDEDDDTPAMFEMDDEGNPIDPDASADEGDEIMAERREAAEGEDTGVDQEAGDPWPGDDAADAEVADDGVNDEATDAEEWERGDGTGDADDVDPAESLDNVSNLFKEAGGQ
ncbi:hypothetical protein ACQ856_18150 [Mycolicibacterium psychrotolerans]|uniref:hypothetical protein n=1 Tax=Mycolicibacterium psychrotolerans TaxID=216929 RepID=UPI003D677E4F